MKFTETALEGAFIVDIEPTRDERAFLPARSAPRNSRNMD